MNSRKRMFFSHVHLTFSLLPIILTLFVLVPPQNARACNWGGEQQQIGFLLQAPIDSTFTNSSCPTISVLGLSIDTTNAIFGGDDDYNSLHCDTLTAGQVVRITFASDTLTSGRLSATSVTSPTCWDGNQGNVLVSGPIQSIATSSATPPHSHFRHHSGACRHHRSYYDEPAVQWRSTSYSGIAGSVNCSSVS